MCRFESRGERWSSDASFDLGTLPKFWRGPIFRRVENAALGFALQCVPAAEHFGCSWVIPALSRTDGSSLGQIFVRCPLSAVRFSKVGLRY